MAMVSLTKPGQEAACRLSLRLAAKDRYRRKRDRKIAVDWIGREFTLLVESQLTGRDEKLQLRVAGYHPDVHNIVMHPTKEVGTITWSTDYFWDLLRRGRLLP